MPGTLYVVATPIGNLEDITLRAVRILREVDLVAAEDTRRTSLLLRHHHVETPVTSFHDHNERQKLPYLVERLRTGANVALVSDAGTPAVSDPGYRLVRACLDEGIRVSPLPGPSAVLSALVVSGLSTKEFTFVGYPPARSAARLSWLKDLALKPETLVLFEAPHRIRNTLSDVLTVLGNRHICVGRELTKVHEQVMTGHVSDVMMRLESPKGELTIVLEGASRSIVPIEPPTATQLALEVGRITENDAVGRREAGRRVGLRYGLSANEVYSRIRGVS